MGGKYPHCARPNRRSRRIEIKPLTQSSEGHVNAVDLGGVLQVGEAIHFLPCGADAIAS